MIHSFLSALSNSAQALRAKRGQAEVDTSNTFELVDSLLSVSGTDDDEEEESSTRQVTILLLRLQWAQTSAHVESMEQEFELLARAPPEEARRGEKDDKDDTWRLDRRKRSLLDQEGPLLDASGRVRQTSFGSAWFCSPIF